MVVGAVGDDGVGMNEDPRIPDPDATDETRAMPAGEEHPKADPPPPPDPVRRLTRSSSDKLLTGVAGGLGRYFRVDPILFRIAFVVLTFAGGVGALAYVALLAFVPSDDGSSVFGDRRGANLAGAIVLGVVVCVLFAAPFFFLGPILIPAAILVGIGLALWRAAGGQPPSGDASKIVLKAVIALLIGIAAVGGFIGVFLLAAIGGGTTLAVLAIVAGVALVVAAFAGGARWLIAPALVLVLPLAIVAAADIDVEGGVGERHYRPAAAADLRPEYKLAVGEMIMDMRDVELPSGTTTMRVEVGVGHALVRVPEDACVSSEVEMGAGHAQVLDRTSDGVDLAFEQTAARVTDAPRLQIDADVGIGALEVLRGDDMPDRGRPFEDALSAGVACP